MIAIAGGYFAWLVFVHFLVDWIPQSHHEAMHKHEDRKIRARHCAIYTLLFLPVLFLFGMCWWKILLSMTIIFISHFAEDTYYAVVLWMKYVRRPPAFEGLNKHFTFKLNKADRTAFRAALMTPINTLLMVVVDQLIHLMFLIPIAWMLAR